MLTLECEAPAASPALARVCVAPAGDTITDLWARRAVVQAEYDRLASAQDRAIDRRDRAEIERLSDAMDEPHLRLWTIDETIIRTLPHSAIEHAIMAQVLELRIGDDGVPDDFVRAYCATIRRLALT